MQGPGRFARAPGQSDESVLRRFPSREAAEQWIEQTRSTNSAMRTDIEVREIEPAASAQPQQGSGSYTYRVFTTDNNQTVGTFQSDGIQGSTNANIAFRNYLTSIGRDSASGFNYEEIGRERSTTSSGAAGSQTDMENRLGWGSQAADANYEIVDRRTNRPVFLFIANTDTEAWRKYGDWLAASGYPEDTEDFGWRRRGDRGQQARSGTEQNERGEFTGQWRVLLNGEEVYRFGGMGNSQSDANRVGRDWILQQIRSGQMQPVEGAEIEVVPVMR